MSAKTERRARKRARVVDQWAKDERESMLALARTMVVCDKCGTVQPFRPMLPWHSDDPPDLIPCDGPIGRSCDCITCTPADYYLAKEMYD